MKSKVIVMIVAMILCLNVLSGCSSESSTVPSTSNNTEKTTSENTNETKKFTTKEIAGYSFSVPDNYSTSRSSNGTTICNDKVFVLVTTSEYDNCESFDDAFEKTKKTAMEGIYSAFGFSAKEMNAKSSEKITNGKGVELLRVNGTLVSLEKEIEFTAYYSIVSGDNGKYPIYWIGISNGTNDMTDTNETMKLIADNFTGK